MEHYCHAVDCSKEVPPKMLMCSRHWFMLPKSIRDKIWINYIPGQEVKKNPTKEYLVVMKEAINFVSRSEK